jgi:hypothetical protein
MRRDLILDGLAVGIAAAAVNSKASADRPQLLPHVLNATERHRKQIDFEEEKRRSAGAQTGYARHPGAVLDRRGQIQPSGV